VDGNFNWGGGGGKSTISTSLSAGGRGWGLEELLRGCKPKERCRKNQAKDVAGTKQREPERRAGPQPNTTPQNHKEQKERKRYWSQGKGPRG